MYKLNHDWNKFEPVLISEFKQLNATHEEIEAILDATWQAATEIEDVEEYAKAELDLLRSFKTE